MTCGFSYISNLTLVLCDSIKLTSRWGLKEVGSIQGLTLLSCLMFSCSCFICSCVFLVLFLSSSFGLLSPYLHAWLSTPFCPSTSLCSGDSPEQRSAASWQRASPVLSLSGDHQWDLHPCACAKLAGGLPQSHTRHYGVCVATHSPASSPQLTVSVVCLFVPSSLLSRPRCSDLYLPRVLSWVFPSLWFQESKSCSRAADPSLLSKLLSTNSLISWLTFLSLLQFLVRNRNNTNLLQLAMEILWKSW